MAAADSAFDISGPLDNGRWTSLRGAVVLMMALAIMFDGMSSQLIGLAAPAILAEFHTTKLAFASVIGLGMAGMAIGAIFGGIFGDRIGRRWASLISIAVFGAGTVAMAWGRDLQGLMVIRFAAGLGLGGLLPNATSLIAEFSPLRARFGAVMAAMTCVPLGGILVGMLASAQMDALGWRMLFIIAGLATLGLAVVLMALLPESPSYLVQDARRHPQLSVILRRLSIDTGGSSTFVDGHGGLGKANAASLFRRPYLGDTLALFGLFLFCHVSSYSFLSWLPALLAQLGLGYRMLGVTTALFNFGGILGALAGAVVISRIGTRLPVLLVCAACVVGALLMMYAKALVDFSPWALTGCLAVMAGGLGVVQCALNPLAIHIFPPQVRATGVGFAGAVGRIGSLVSSFSAAAALDFGGARLFFLSIAFVMALGGVCLFLIKRHAQPVSRDGDVARMGSAIAAAQPPTA